jgi:ribonuclease HIII
MDNKAFIDSLKVGDLVAVRIYSYGAICYNLLKVEEIAARAGKRTVVVNGVKYDDVGGEKRERGAMSSGIGRSIGPITNEVRASIKRRREQNTITNFSDWESLSDDKIARIAAILKE